MSDTLTLPAPGAPVAAAEDKYKYKYLIAIAVTLAAVLELIDTSNLKRLTVDTLAAGLNPTQPLFVDLGLPLDGLSDTIVLTAYRAPPSAVTRDGIVTNLWIYDAVASELRLLAVDGLAHAWVITP